MKRQKVTKYQAGYFADGGRNRLLRLGSIGLLGALGAALLCALGGCRDKSPSTLMGDVPYYDPDATATTVSASDTGEDGNGNGGFMLDGDVIYEEESSDETNQG